MKKYAYITTQNSVSHRVAAYEYRKYLDSVYARTYFNDADVIFIHDVPTTWIAYTCRLRNINKKAIMVGIWDRDDKSVPRSYCRYLKSVDWIWVASEFSKESFVECTTTPISVIPHIVRDVHETDVDKNYIMSVCDLANKNKNPDVLISLCNKIYKELGIKSVIKSYGNTNGIEHTEGIRFINNVIPSDRMDALYSGCYGYLSPHKGEGFGLAIAEAASIGRHVWVPKHSGPAEYLPLDMKTWIPCHDDGFEVVANTLYSDPHPQLQKAIINNNIKAKNAIDAFMESV